MAKKSELVPPELRLRVSEALRKKIEDAAAARGASLNGEIAQRLEDSFGHPLLLPVLKALHGDVLGELAAQAAYAGILTVKDEEIEAAEKLVRRLLETVQQGKKFK